MKVIMKTTKLNIDTYTSEQQDIILSGFLFAWEFFNQPFYRLVFSWYFEVPNFNSKLVIA